MAGNQQAGKQAGKQGYEPPLEAGEQWGGTADEAPARVESQPAEAPSGGAGSGPAPGHLPATADGRGFVHDPTPRRDIDPDTTGVVGQALNLVDPDGRVYLAAYDRDPDGAPRIRYAVTVIEAKVPYRDRWTRGLLDTAADEAERQYASLYRPLDEQDPRSQRGAADTADDDQAFPVGVESWWRAYLTEDEVERGRAAVNTRSVSYETRFGPV